MRRFDWDNATVLEDLRRDYGERRFRAYGMLDDASCMVAFTTRDETVRVISLRRMNRREVKRHGH